MFSLTITAHQEERFSELLCRYETARVQQRAGQVSLPHHDLKATLQQLANLISNVVRAQVLPPERGGQALLLPLVGVPSTERPEWGGFPVAGLAYDGAGVVYLATVGDKSEQRPQGIVTLLATVRRLNVTDLPALVGVARIILHDGLVAADAAKRPVYQAETLELEPEEEDAPSGRLAAILGRYE
jgi:hypothetical protein